KRGPDQVVLEIWFREIDTGIFGWGRKFRHLQRLIVDPEQFTCTVQPHPQIAVPVGAELAGDRIFHAERKLVDLAGSAVDARELVEGILDDPDVAVAANGHP